MVYCLSFLTFSIILTALASCQRISLIGSHFLPLESKYTAFISTHNIDELGTNGSIKLTLQSKGYSKTYDLESYDDNSLYEIEYDLPEKKSNDYSLKIQVNSEQKCVQQSVRIKNLQDYPIAFIYLNKPIYKPGDILTFRVFLLGQDLRPYSENYKLDVRFFDSKGHSIYNITDINPSKFSFVERDFTIPESQNFGNWKIEVQANSRRKSKEFKVQPQNEAKFDVFVNMSDTIAYEDKVFSMTILTRPENDKVFQGSAQISVKGKYWSSNQHYLNKVVKTVNLIGNKNDIVLKFHEDLAIFSPDDDMDLIFDISVNDNSSQNIIRVRKEVGMKQNGRSNIQVIRKKYFKPGFKFPIKIRVKLMNGQPDNSLNLLKMTVEYKTSNGVTKNKKSSEIILNNGETSTFLTPAADTDKIITSFEIGETKMTEIIQKFSTYGINEFMQVSFVNKSSKVGDTIQLQAHTTGEMETLHLLVYGLNGLIYSEEFSDAVGKDLYTFRIKLLEKMKPEIRGLVFYIRPVDGIMVYDEFALSLGFSIDNSLEISAPSHAKPNEEIEITVKSEIDSFVIITGIDKNTELFNNENEISRTDIYNDLTYYLNFSVPNVHDYKFEKVNNYVMEPLQNGVKCGLRQPSTPSISELNEGKPWIQKYFPNTWFDKAFTMTTGTEKIRIKVPNKVKNWKIYGISVHESKGFTVAKKQPEITVNGDFVININAPSTVKEGEIFQVDVYAYNFKASYLQSTIRIEVTNGNIVNHKKREHSGKICHIFDQSYQSLLDMSKQLEPEKVTYIGSFYVKSNYAGKLQIKADTWQSASSEKNVNVKQIENESRYNFDIKGAVKTKSNNEATVIIDARMVSTAYLGLNMVMEVELPSGYRYDSYDFANHIANIKYDSNINSLNIFFNRVDTNTNYITSINILKVFNVYELRKLAVKIYDLNRRDQQDIFLYHYDVNLGLCNEVIEATKCGWKVWNCLFTR